GKLERWYLACDTTRGRGECRGPLSSPRISPDGPRRARCGAGRHRESDKRPRDNTGCRPDNAPGDARSLLCSISRRIRGFRQWAQAYVPDGKGCDALFKLARKYLFRQVGEPVGGCEGWRLALRNEIAQTGRLRLDRSLAAQYRDRGSVRRLRATILRINASPWYHRRSNSLQGAQLWRNEHPTLHGRVPAVALLRARICPIQTWGHSSRWARRT